jgi:hypothetical protein
LIEESSAGLQSRKTSALIVVFEVNQLFGSQKQMTLQKIFRTVCVSAALSISAMTGALSQTNHYSYAPNDFYGMGGMQGMQGMGPGYWALIPNRMGGMQGMYPNQNGMRGMYGMQGMGPGYWALIPDGQGGMQGMYGMQGMRGMYGMQGMGPGYWAYVPDGMSGMGGMQGMGGMAGMTGSFSASLATTPGWTCKRWVYKTPGLSGMAGMTGMQGMGGMAGMSDMKGMAAKTWQPPATKKADNTKQ